MPVQYIHICSMQQDQQNLQKLQVALTFIFYCCYKHTHTAITTIKTKTIAKVSTTINKALQTIFSLSSFVL